MADNVATLIKKAVHFHQSGDLDEAVRYYEQALAADPEHADALYLCGTVQLQLGLFDACIDLLSRVTALRPDVPDAHNNLGVAYQALGRWEEAACSFREAIRVNPRYEQALFNLGALMEDRALFADAETFFRKAVEINADDANTRNRLGNVLKAEGKWSDAEACYRKVATADPENLDVAVNLGYVLARQDRLDEAIAVYRQILKTRPDYPEIHNSLSYIFERQGKFDDAVSSARRAIEFQPDFAEGYNNLATAVRAQHHLEEACRLYQKAIELQPGFALAEFNYGTTQLLGGNYRSGWPGFQRYADIRDAPPRRFNQPRWNGEPIEDGTLFVYADQGFGDTLQFVRFLAAAKERVRSRLIFECQPELKPLLQGQVAADTVVADNEAVPPTFTFQVPLEHLPEILDVELATLRGEGAYLKSPPSLPEQLAHEFERMPPANIAVGLVWQGNPLQARDAVRSCPLEALLPLVRIPGLSWYSLQTGEAAGRVKELDDRIALMDLGSRLRNFSETAAVMSRLALLISVDTAAAHLAGALGRPVWTLLCHTPDWRWHLERSDSPWYRSMRLFRQPTWGNWDAVVAEVGTELNRLLAQSRQ